MLLPIVGSIAAYMGLLSLLATTSPGVGPLGHMLLLLSGQFLDFLHIPAYGFLAWLVTTGLLKRSWPTAYALSAGPLLALVFGLWTETLQASVPGRGPETKDLLNDAIGIATAGIFVLKKPSFCHAASLIGRRHATRPMGAR